jgi:hypothetical protein
MRIYLNFVHEQNNSLTEAVGKLGIPKIMGFDYIMDVNRRLFLLEVNRFPGLEPRDVSDIPVKQGVVCSAWELAIGRLDLNKQQAHRLGDINAELCTFERLI